MVKHGFVFKTRGPGRNTGEHHLKNGCFGSSITDYLQVLWEYKVVGRLSNSRRHRLMNILIAYSVSPLLYRKVSTGTLAEGEAKAEAEDACPR